MLQGYDNTYVLKLCTNVGLLRTNVFKVMNNLHCRRGQDNKSNLHNSQLDIQIASKTKNKRCHHIVDSCWKKSSCDIQQWICKCKFKIILGQEKIMKDTKHVKKDCYIK